MVWELVTLPACFETLRKGFAPQHEESLCIAAGLHPIALGFPRDDELLVISFDKFGIFVLGKGDAGDC